MEVGQFTRVDWRLTELKQLLKNKKLDNEERLRHYWGKYYHIQGKNSWRGHYYQRAYETFMDGIEYFEKEVKSKKDRTNLKYLCKLYEG
jgi:hypothetical protein